MHYLKGYPKFVPHGCNFTIISHGWNLFLTAVILLIISQGRMFFLTGVILFSITFHKLNFSFVVLGIFSRFVSSFQGEKQKFSRKGIFFVRGKNTNGHAE